eukprot:SAG31_NODE_3192_length_4571_cov_2.313730_4_plen_268_part_00
MRASYIEIYNEDIRDLLKKDPVKLDLKDGGDGVYVKDLTDIVCKSVDDINRVFQAGTKNRTVGATLMNADSSRSHSIFTIVIEQASGASDGGQMAMGKLNLVDLAGSERQTKTGATGDRLKEATKINLSLSALGNVIKALVDPKKGHIPYRDSKLTRLLQDSLGGNAKTVMVANMGPADYNFDESLNTLRCNPNISVIVGCPFRWLDRILDYRCILLVLGMQTEPNLSKISPKLMKTQRTQCYASFRTRSPSSRPKLRRGSQQEVQQ